MRVVRKMGTYCFDLLEVWPLFFDKMIQASVVIPHFFKSIQEAPRLFIGSDIVHKVCIKT